MLTSLLAGVASAPFGAYHFGQIQLYFILANLVAVPLTALWVMPAGLVALALMPLGLGAMGADADGLGHRRDIVRGAWRGRVAGRDDRGRAWSGLGAGGAQPGCGVAGALAKPGAAGRPGADRGRAAVGAGQPAGRPAGLRRMRG